MKLSDKVAIVTGAGRGIGRAIAVHFATEGAKLAIAARTVREIEETASNIREIGPPPLVRRSDVSVVEDVRNLVNDTVRQFGRLDILVNAAGVLGPVGPMMDDEISDWINAININLIGTFLCCRFALPIMIEQHAGKIINFSGGGATSPYPMFSAYAASKAAVVGLTQTLAEEVKESNVQVNAIAPGLVNTRMQDEILAAGTRAGLRATARAREAKEKGGSPTEEVSALAIFLGSSDSGQLTGRLISAVWDNWRSFTDKSALKQIMASELYTLRRIDGTLFVPKNEQDNK